MIIHVYAVCYNEEILMPYFLRHYGSFADQIFVFDNHSTDKTIVIVDSFPKATRIPFDTGDTFDDMTHIAIKNLEYKKRSRGIADWVVVVDSDEFVYHPNIISVLQNYKNLGVTLPKVSGFDMVSSALPSTSGQIYDEIKDGVFHPGYSKGAVFDPSIDINYEPGAHRCHPAGNIKESRVSEIKLLHYRFLGADFFVRRMRLHDARCSERNKKLGLSVLRLPVGVTVDDFANGVYQKKWIKKEKII